MELYDIVINVSIIIGTVTISTCILLVALNYFLGGSYEN